MNCLSSFQSRTTCIRSTTCTCLHHKRRRQGHRSSLSLSLLLLLLLLLIGGGGDWSSTSGWKNGIYALNSSSSSSHSNNHNKEDPIIDAFQLKQALWSGRVYQHLNFVTENEIHALQEEIRLLQQDPDNGFTTKGLSNTVELQTKQEVFDPTKDRAICPVPWFHNALLWKDDGGGAAPATKSVADKLHRLWQETSHALDRPSMIMTTTPHDTNDAATTSLLLSHECYYSISQPSSRLPRHMDERHEETKGSQGWLRPSRRSVSWLIYIHDIPTITNTSSSTSSSTTTNPIEDDSWSLERHGGALRTFPQRQQSVDQPILQDSTHDGNLQVGWLIPSSSNSSSPSVAVYLDSWYKVVPTATTVEVVTDVQLGDETPPILSTEPHCILYTTTSPTSNITGNKDDRQLLTRPWLTEQIPNGMSMVDFLQAVAQHDAAVEDKTGDSTVGSNPVEQQEQPPPQRILFTTHEAAKQFYPLEERQTWDQGEDPTGSDIVDVIPHRGSLVMFDSVTLPHQVEWVKEGATRVALAGWFHEATQAFPDDFYTPQEEEEESLEE